MQKLILTLVLAAIACGASSQTGSATKNDSCVCVSPAEIRTALKVDDSLRIAKRSIKNADSVIAKMKEAVSVRDDIEKKNKQLQAIDQLKISNLDKQIANKDETLQLSLDYTSYLKKLFKKERKKVIVISGVSLSVIGTLTYLLVK